MSKIRELLEQGRHEELWQMCCGFLDLNLEQVMAIQKRLLLEQIQLLNRCKLGRKLLRGAFPETVEEFRKQVPLTSYDDYCPELPARNEDVLPTKPRLWITTFRRSGENPKWIPFSHKFWQEAALNFNAMAIFGTCKGRGDIPFKSGLKLLYAACSPPYLTGTVARSAEEDLGFEFLPPLPEAERMTLEERVDNGFWRALSDGIDGFFGLGGILIAIGERFRQGSGTMKLSRLASQPKAMTRLAKGLIKSKLAGRTMLPKDLWSIRLISSMGPDCVVYKDKIKELWGREPLNVYGNSESAVIATQTWDFGSMVFFPNLNFFEFIPEEEYFKLQLDPTYRPKTVLLDEVKAGEIYELVITNFHGGIMTRYRIGDMVRITALRNEELDIDIPQMVFERRADEFIDLGFIRLTERIIWQALENTSIPYRGWTAHMEMVDNPTLHLYIELEANYIASEEGIAAAIYEQIKRVNADRVYNEIASLERLGDYRRPIEVTLLPDGAFASYKRQRQAEGADLIDLKPPHINPTDAMLADLCTKVKVTPKPEPVTTRRPKVPA